MEAIEIAALVAAGVVVAAALCVAAVVAAVRWNRRHHTRGDH